MGTLSLISGESLALLVNGIKKEFTSKKEMNKELRSLEKKGFSFPSNFMDQDEFDGLCQANQLGMKTFQCTIIG